MTRDAGQLEKGTPMLSVVIPVYRNEENIPPLIEALETMYEALDGAFGPSRWWIVRPGM